MLVLSDNRHDQMSWAGHLKEVYIVFLGVFLFLDRKSFENSNNFFQRFIPFFVVAVYCAFDSPDIFLSLQKTLSYFLLLAVVPNYVTKLYLEDAARFFRMIFGVASLILFTGLVLYYFLLHDFVAFGDRYCGLLGNPNGLGIFCMMIFLLLSTVRDIHPETFERKEYFFFYGLLFFTIFLTGARSSILAICIFMLFNYFNRMSAFLGIIVFLVIILTYRIIEQNFESIVSALGWESYIRVETINTASGRIVAWTFAWEEIQKNLFFGKGFSYTEHLFHVNMDSLGRKGHQGNAHNSYLTIWLETGFVGLVFYLFALFSAFFRSFKNTTVTIAIMYALLFQIFFESWLASSLNPYTINLVIILVIAMEAKKEIPVPQIEVETQPDFFPQRFVPR